MALNLAPFSPHFWYVYGRIFYIETYLLASLKVVPFSLVFQIEFLCRHSPLASPKVVPFSLVFQQRFYTIFELF